MPWCRIRSDARVGHQELSSSPLLLDFSPETPVQAPFDPTYITLNVSQTSMLPPPIRTGQPFAAATAASRLSALMTL